MQTVGLIETDVMGRGCRFYEIKSGQGFEPCEK